MQKKKTAIFTARMTPKVKAQLQQRAQGCNLNQLTTLANMGRFTVLRSDEIIEKYDGWYLKI